jgi:hypothetical protein
MRPTVKVASYERKKPEPKSKPAPGSARPGANKIKSATTRTKLWERPK